MKNMWVFNTNLSWKSRVTPLYQAASAVSALASRVELRLV
jgi:hypothetical protein